MGKLLHNPFANIKCPVCGKKTIIDPDAGTGPMLPPTGGDYEYASQWLNSVNCKSCNTFFTFTKKIERVAWADNWDVAYYWEYPYVKRIKEVKVEHLIIQK